jgi:BMFP domain-containing protein YqiC
MIGALVVLGVLAAVAVAARRVVRSLQARVAALEARTDAAQRWQDEVRKVLDASKA